MSQTDKATYWQELKEAGVKFDLPYHRLRTSDLKAAYDKLQESIKAEATSAAEQPKQSQPKPGGQNLAPRVPVSSKSSGEFAGARLNTQDPDEPIRIDPETGFIWYQEEVRKPGHAVPRARRVYDYIDPGTETQTVVDSGAGKFLETFEVPGGRKRAAQARVTLPSHQVGVYRDPRFRNFKIHVYNGVRGFDFRDVNAFFGGADLVPSVVKRIYVEKTLCYDIQSVRAALTEQANNLRLGRV